MTFILRSLPDKRDVNPVISAVPDKRDVSPSDLCPLCPWWEGTTITAGFAVDVGHCDSDDAHQLKASRKEKKTKT